MTLFRQPGSAIPFLMLIAENEKKNPNDDITKKVKIRALSVCSPFLFRSLGQTPSGQNIPHNTTSGNPRQNNYKGIPDPQNSDHVTSLIQVSPLRKNNTKLLEVMVPLDDSPGLSSHRSGDLLSRKQPDSISPSPGSPIFSNRMSSPPYQFPKGASIMGVNEVLAFSQRGPETSECLPQTSDDFYGHQFMGSSAESRWSGGTPQGMDFGKYIENTDIAEMYHQQDLFGQVSSPGIFQEARLTEGSFLGAKGPCLSQRLGAHRGSATSSAEGRCW